MHPVRGCTVLTSILLLVSLFWTEHLHAERFSGDVGWSPEEPKCHKS